MTDRIRTAGRELALTGMFDHDLYGFAAQAAAAELVAHWRQCDDPPLTEDQKRSDLADVIAALQNAADRLVTFPMGGAK